MNTFVELTGDECRDLLKTDTVGRVAFNTPAGPRIVPVNFTLGEDEVLILTSPYSELATYAVGERVAFEIDHLDGERRRGWSVVAHGVCRWVDGLRHGDQDGVRQPEPWAGGNRPTQLRIAWTELSGRRVGGDHWPHPVVSDRGHQP